MFVLENSVDYQHRTYSKACPEICLTPLFIDIQQYTSKKEFTSLK